MKHRCVAACLVCMISVETFATDLTIEQLGEKCDKKQFVMSGSGEIVGDKLNDYCSGYLTATLDALRHMPNIKCDNKGPQDVHYLLSVLRTYLKKANLSNTDNASRALLSAYSRAFGCFF